ncbi:uncharacterized protein LOC143427425 isoform X2 [Xylocopa sonorina]|uniref:uncharacterized protein LOC143427425 isoform X2 n=1 Tax=Xylocopa sonorina TaxID=1818115 RepID=UPI00403A92DF
MTRFVIKQSEESFKEFAQVRQQSKEISDRLLERTKNIAREELKKLEDNTEFSLRQIYNGKIMEVQQKYQEDMADIGQAHICASLEPDHDMLIEEQERRNKLAALKRGQEAAKQIKDIQQKETQQQQHQERLRQVREVENLRSTMIANLPKQTVPEEDTVCITIQNEVDNENKQQKFAKKRTKKLSSKRSAGKVTKTYTKVVGSDSKTRLHAPNGKSKQKTSEINLEPESSDLQQQSVSNSITESLGKQIEQGTEPNDDDNGPRKQVPTKVDKSQRYNPEDYVQTTSDSNNNDSSSSFSDDSSYFSDSGEQYINREVKPTKYVKCPAFDKVQLYDHSKRQKNEYVQPVGAVEKISTWNEPSAIDLAQEIERTQSAELHLTESRKYNAQKRGEDAALREKVRRDYQTLMKNLDHLASEERKLKASQVERYPKGVYLQEERRKLLRDQHKQKLNHALETLLNDESSEQYVRCPGERQITLTPLENNKDTDAHVTWEQSHCFSQRPETSRISQNQTKVIESETSREEQILDMLKKVERQKRLLLQEFGADLPNNIFNASIKSLFERDKSVQTQTETELQDADVQKPLSPEIKVISTSFEEKNKKDKTEKVLADSVVKKVEIAVQTTTEDKDSITQDKSTQVEPMQEKTNEFTSVSNEVHKASKHYPLEPEIVVIQPDVDSSESTSSEIVNVVTEFDKQAAKVVTPKKKKSKEKPLRQTPSKSYHKSRMSKTTSSAKRFPKSLTKSQYTSTKKCTSSDDVPDKKIKMYIDKNGFNITMKPPQVAEVLVDVSTQSAQVYSTGTQKQTTSKQQWIQSKSKRIKIKDISDTSTSFASPPPIKPKDILEALHNNISILEMLDSSASESMRYLKRDVSPVSTPETPSPRTMMMPSNIPRPERIRKFLRYSSTDSQTNDYNTLSSTKNDYSTSTDSSEYQPQPDERLSTESEYIQKESPISLEFCLCHNPECRQVHAKFEQIRNYALKNCPQILQKYEDLQNTCAERIISLTNLIEKVRDEQKGVEFSMVDPGDETSLMQLPPPRIMANDLQSIRKLVENIEAIHNQLAKTLIDSQKIIEGKTVFMKEDDEIKETEKIISIDDGVAKMTLDPIDEKMQAEKIKAKPKIISDEIVNIQINKYKTRKSPQMVTSTPQRDAWLSQKHIEEKMIEQLSKEILEQSKGLNNNNLITSNEIYSTVNHSIQTSTDNDDFKTDTSTTQRNYTSVRRHFNKELKRTKDFIPLLDDIPKVSKTMDNSTHTNGRSKPPVSLLSGPYRVETESPGHELSTIIEFDTPDTVNKSQNNIRSPLQAKRLAEAQITKSTAIVKPSEHIIASLNLSDLRPEKLCNSSIKKSPSMAPVQKLKETTIFPNLQNMSKNVGSRDTTIWNKDVKKESIIEEREMSNQKLQCEMVHQGLSRIEEVQPFGSTSSDPNKESKDNKDKITSTSSNSFSELSGVSQIASTPSSTMLKYASSPEEMEIALKKLGLGWAITTLKKTREASALSSSSNSDVTPMNTAKRISPVKKQFDSNYGLLDFSDVSSISIKEASKSTEQAVLLKGRTSTPKLQNSNSNSVEISTSNTNNSDNFREPDNALIIPNISLTKTKSNVKKLEDL